MAKLERTYNVPLRKSYLNTPRYKRAKKASVALRIFLEKHMKSDEVKIGQHLNHHIWSKGIKNPPHHVKVKAIRDDDGVVRAELEGYDFSETVRPEEVTEEQTGLAGLADKVGGKPKKESKPDEKPKESDSKGKADTKKDEKKAKSESPEKTAKKASASKKESDSKSEKSKSK